MLRVRNYWFLLFLILLSIDLFALENVSLSDRIWIKQNLLKPQANLVFILTIEPKMLSVSQNPSENIQPLLMQANHQILREDFDNARINIDKAYELEPGSSNIYISELMYQFYQGLIRFKYPSTGIDNKTIEISYDFLLKAEKEHPNNDVPVMIHHGLNVMQYFYTTLLNDMDKFKLHKAFQFSGDISFQQSLQQSQNYFERVIKNKDSDSYYAQLNLLMLAIIKNETLLAKQYFNQLQNLPEVNNDVYRLITIHDISQAHFSTAIQHMKMSLQLADNVADRQMLASLYSNKGDHHQALKTLQNFPGSPSAELVTQQLGYTLLAGDFRKAERFYQPLKSNSSLLQMPDFVYYSLVIELLNKDELKAKRYLEKLNNTNDLFNSAQQFIKRFNYNPQGDSL